ncbi:MAG: SDR family NAD(P)-dependent oxidoreductase [Acidimicrobiia bacterium]|nr:SDR family NAD(P)-dependent oxidoreductase [Acidimicrobiia bacterium]
MRIDGSVAFITGGASGLGRGAAEALVERGAKVAILDLPGSDGASVAAGLGADAVFVPADVRDTVQVEQAVAAALGAFGKLNLLVNAAGVVTAHRVVARNGELFPLDLFKSTIEVNLIGLFDVVRRVAAEMGNNEPDEGGERGAIVNVASIAAYEGQIGQAAYSASKGGIVGLTLPLARDLASAGIRVNTIAPGIMDTPMLAGAPQELKDALAQVHVFPRRLGTPQDFAHLVIAVFENPMLNGEVIRLDAGARMGPR